MSGQIAEFWASLGFKVDPDELKKVDKFLGDAEKRLKGNSKKKTEESKATDKVTKAVKEEVAAKAASVNADVAATKAINQKASATRKLTAAEREAQRVGARLRSTPFVNTAVQQRINSMFPAMAGDVLGARSQDRRLLTSFYRGAFDKVAKKPTPVAAEKVPLANFSPRDMVAGGKRGDVLQRRINSMFPSMQRGTIPERSQDRRHLEMFYRGAFDRAEKGGVGVRNPAAAEGRALGRIGMNSPAFGATGRVADLIRQRRVQPESSALGSLGMNNPRFKPLGSAFRAYDEKLDQAVARTRAQMAERQRLKHLALTEQRLSYLAPSKTRSPEMKSMSDFYTKQAKAAKEEANLKKKGLESEKDIERTRRRGVVSARRTARTERLRAANPTAQPRASVAMASYGRSPASHSSGNYLRAGGAGGAFARYGVGSLPFIGGAYGFSTLNRANQEALTTRLTTQAVLQGHEYTEEQGVEAFDWLRDLGNEIGFSYMDAAPDYNQFLANSLGAGMSIEGSQDIFKGLSEYQTAMGTTSYRRQLINNALSQMMGKGVLSMEEVRRQMADSLPGTISLFSDAYAELIGSGETGLDAQARFYRDIATGTIKSAEILPIFARLASERAAPKMDIMKKTSIAEQGRSRNEMSDLLMAASKSGVEDGFKNFWKGVTDGAKALTPVIRGLAGSFEDFTKLLRPMTRSLGQVNNLFEAISKTTGVAEKNLTNLVIVGGLMATKWGRVGLIFSSVFMVLEDISMGINGEGKSVTGDFLNWLEEGGIKLGAFERALFGVSAGLLAIALGMKTLRGLGLLGNLFKIPTTNPDLVGPRIGRGRRAARSAGGAVGTGARLLGGPALGMGAMATYGLAALAGATMYSAYKSYNTSTDEFREKYGLNFGKDSFMGDLGVRVLGTLADLGNTLTFGYAEKLGEWLGGVTYDLVEGAKEMFTETKDVILSYIQDTWDSIMSTLSSQFDRFHNFMAGLIPEWARPASLRSEPEQSGKTFDNRTWFEALVWDKHYSERARAYEMSREHHRQTATEKSPASLPTVGSGVLDIKFQATVQAATISDLNTYVEEEFGSVLDRVFAQYGITE